VGHSLESIAFCGSEGTATLYLGVKIGSYIDGFPLVTNPYLVDLDELDCGTPRMQDDTDHLHSAIETTWYSDVQHCNVAVLDQKLVDVLAKRQDALMADFVVLEWRVIPGGAFFAPVACPLAGGRTVLVWVTLVLL
jgi:hypothetical protein